MLNQAAPLSPIEVLAEQASQHAKEISDYLRATNHPHPSFERDAPATTLPPSAPNNMKEARVKLTEAALKLFQLAIGPAELLPDMMASVSLCIPFHHLECKKVSSMDGMITEIFSLVPREGSIAYDTVAKSAEVAESQLKRVARMATTWNVLCEPTPGHIAHTAASALLANNPNLCDWAVYLCEVSVPTAAKMVEATKKWPDSVEKNETAYNVAFDTDLPFFTHMSGIPERAKMFSSYMKSVTHSEGTDFKHLINGFDWATLDKGSTVVDVGGSTGHVTYALAKAFPDLRFIVEDLPHVIANGEATLVSQPESIATRVSFQPHDFFQPQPVQGAAVYLLRMILHDWPDKEAVTITSQLVPALAAGSTLVIMDTVLPAPGQIPSSKERLLRVRDLTMMQVFNSKERTLDDWKSILEAADSRLRICEVKQPIGSNMSVMTVRLENQMNGITLPKVGF